MSARKLAVAPLVKPALKTIAEVRRGTPAAGPIVVDGVRTLVPLVAQALREGGDPAFVREGGDLSRASALVWVGEPDAERLRAATRARVPIVALVGSEQRLPYVLDTDVVVAPRGLAVPADELAARLAVRLGDRGLRLAARLPVLREAVVDHLIRRYARRNGLIGAAVWIPGVDMPVLTLNQVRLVLRIALAHGHEIDSSRYPEMLGVVGAGFGFRALARQVLTLVPVAGWATRGAVAYTGTRAIGEAARRRFDHDRP